MPGKGNLQLTGKLGEVIRESAQIALSWVKSNAFALGITSSASDLFLQDRDIHLHVSSRLQLVRTRLVIVLTVQSPNCRCLKVELARRDPARVPPCCPLSFRSLPRPRSTPTLVSHFDASRFPPSLPPTYAASVSIALTGEITLLGQVLPVGGLKEKM